MDCPRCTYVLEHPDRALAESELWTDLPECCQETLQLVRLERGWKRMMPQIEPDASLDDAILVAARKHAKPSLAAAAPPLEPVGTSGISWVSRLRRWVTAPQVAMATITALAVVIGIFYVPSRERFLEAEGDTVMPVAHESHQVAREESPEFRDNAPLIPSGPMLGGSKPPPPSATAPSSNAAQGIALRRAAEESALAERSALADDEARAASTATGGGASENAPSLLASMGAAREEEVASSGEVARRSDSLALAPAAPSRGAAVPYAAAAPAAPAPAPAPTTRAAAPATEAGGLASADSIDLLAQARALRSRGQCAAAVPVYDRWFAESSSGPRADATMELADCLAATGRTDRARQLYARATTYPAVASRAREELASLDRATGRTATSATAARARSAGAPSAAAAEAADSAAAAPSEPSGR